MAHLTSLGSPEWEVPLASCQSIRVPVLFVSGEADPLFPSEQLASYVPHFQDARLEVIKDAGHSPYFEQPGVFNRLLATFLERGNA